MGPQDTESGGFPDYMNRLQRYAQQAMQQARQTGDQALVERLTQKLQRAEAVGQQFLKPQDLQSQGQGPVSVPDPMSYFRKSAPMSQQIQAPPPDLSQSEPPKQPVPAQGDNADEILRTLNPGSTSGKSLSDILRMHPGMAGRADQLQNIPFTDLRSLRQIAEPLIQQSEGAGNPFAERADVQDPSGTNKRFLEAFRQAGVDEELQKKRQIRESSGGNPITALGQTLPAALAPGEDIPQAGGAFRSPHQLAQDASGSTQTGREVSDIQPTPENTLNHIRQVASSGNQYAQDLEMRLKAELGDKPELWKGGNWWKTILSALLMGGRQTLGAHEQELSRYNQQKATIGGQVYGAAKAGERQQASQQAIQQKQQVDRELDQMKVAIQYARYATKDEQDRAKAQAHEIDSELYRLNQQVTAGIMTLDQYNAAAAQLKQQLAGQMGRVESAPSIPKQIMRFMGQ